MKPQTFGRPLLLGSGTATLVSCVFSDVGTVVQHSGGALQLLTVDVVLASVLEWRLNATRLLWDSGSTVANTVAVSLVYVMARGRRGVLLTARSPHKLFASTAFAGDAGRLVHVAYHFGVQVLRHCRPERGRSSCARALSGAAHAN